MTAAFSDKNVIAELTAKMLLEVEAVRFMADKPFIFTSGWASPVYTDCRRLISFPRVRRTLIDFAAGTILREAGFEQFDAVAGGETAGIPFAAWMADRLELPMLYVRKKPKGFGRNAQIEGNIIEGQRVLLVEDMTSDGRSKANFCNASAPACAAIWPAMPRAKKSCGPRNMTSLCLPGSNAGGSAADSRRTRAEKLASPFPPARPSRRTQFCGLNRIGICEWKRPPNQCLSLFPPTRKKR